MTAFRIRRPDDPPGHESALTESEILMALQLNSLAGDDLIFENESWISLAISKAFSSSVKRHSAVKIEFKTLLHEFAQGRLAWVIAVALALLAMIIFMILNRAGLI
jgi:hypothetical protein